MRNRRLRPEVLVAWIGSLVMPCTAAPGDIDPGFDAGLSSRFEELWATAGMVRGDGDVSIAFNQRKLLTLAADDSAARYSSSTNIHLLAAPRFMVELDRGRVLLAGGKPTFAGLDSNGNWESGWSSTALAHVSGVLGACVKTPHGELLAGFSSSFYSDTVSLLRCDFQGRRVPGFESALRGAGTIAALWPMADGRILVGGLVTNPLTGSPQKLIRLLANGSVDPNFIVPANITGRYVREWVGDGAGSLFALVDKDPPNGMEASPASTRVVRLRDDGSADPATLAWEGRPDAGTLRTLLTDGDGLWVGGPRLIRLAADGRPDTARVAPQPVPTAHFPHPTVFKLLQQSDRSIVVIGVFARVRLADGSLMDRPGFFRMSPTGELDINYGRTGFNDGVKVHPLFVPASDGSLLAAGGWRVVNGGSYPFLCRFQPDGALDLGFAFNRFPFRGPPVVAELGDRQFLAGADATVIRPGEPPSTLFLLDSRGRIRALPEFTGPVKALARQSDGHVIVAGYFETNGRPAPLVLRRLRPDGTVDPAFHATATPARSGVAYPVKLALHLDGRIVVGMSHTAEVRRFLRNGEPDTEFEAGPQIGQNPEVPPNFDLAILDDGAVVAVGDAFLYRDATGVGVVRRWRPDGRIDRTFTPHIDGYPQHIAPAGLGRFVVSGFILSTNLGRTGNLGLIRCLPNGQVDPTFQLSDAITSASGLVTAGDAGYCFANFIRGRELGSSYTRLIRFDNRTRSLGAPLLTPAGVRLQLVAPAGESHMVEASSDLQDWHPVGAFVMPAGNVFEWTLPLQSPVALQFYRERRLE